MVDANPNVNIKSQYGHTALHMAAWKGHTGVVKILPDAKVDIDAQLENGAAAPHLAAR
jgi:ankyrin repeat protein